MFDTAFHIRQVKGHSSTVIFVNGSFYMAEKRTGLLLYPFPRFQKSFGKSCFSICVVSMDMPFQTYCNAPCLFHRGLLGIGILFFAVVTVTFVTVLMVVVVGGHCIIS